MVEANYDDGVVVDLWLYESREFSILFWKVFDEAVLDFEASALVNVPLALCYPCFTLAHAPFPYHVCAHSLLMCWHGAKHFGSAQEVCSDVAVLFQQIGGHVCTATDSRHPFDPWSVHRLEICLQDPLRDIITTCPTLCSSLSALGLPRLFK